MVLLQGPAACHAGMALLRADQSKRQDARHVSCTLLTADKPLACSRHVSCRHGSCVNPTFCMNSVVGGGRW
jgi:hypothetical protein